MGSAKHDREWRRRQDAIRKRQRRIQGRSGNGSQRRQHQDRYADKAPPRPRQCTRADGTLKHAYSEDEAHETAQSMRDTGRAPDARAYKCGNCNWWHTTGRRLLE